MTLPKGSTVETWTESLGDRFFKQLLDARLVAEEEARMKEDVRRQQRREAQAMVRAVERRKVA